MDGETATRQDERLQFGARVVAPENAAPEVHLPQTLRAPSPPVPTSSLTPLARLGPVLRRSFDSELEHGTAFVFVPVLNAVISSPSKHAFKLPSFESKINIDD